jgi:molybdenum cofactor cytidylyltransferase
MELKQALRATAAIQAAVVGSGGKTSTLFRLAREMVDPVIVTTSTHLGKEQLSLADRNFIVTSNFEIESLREEIFKGGVTLITGPVNAIDRATSLDENALFLLHTLALKWNISLLVEADGSRGLPLKAPGQHEPAIPAWIDNVIVVTGLSALGKPFSDDVVHRAKEFSALTGIQTQDPITIQHVQRMLNHADGGLKNIPRSAKRIALLNQADDLPMQQQALELADGLRDAYDLVLIASLKNSQNPVSHAIEPVAGIILAAGGSTRFGQSKLLLDWFGQPFIRRVAITAIEANLSPVIVVTGVENEPFLAALSGLPVQIMVNPDWTQGQSTSVRVGIQALPGNTGAAVVFVR